jgi:hypothetical protein
MLMYGRSNQLKLIEYLDIIVAKFGCGLSAVVKCLPSLQSRIISIITSSNGSLK